MSDPKAHASLKVLGFCEGARADTGGIGLIGVPLIHQALARRGHRDALAVGGRPMPSAEGMIRTSIQDTLVSKAVERVGVVSFPAVGRWCFSPSLAQAAHASVPHVDFVTLHSLYSFPVLAGYALAKRFRKPFGLWPHGVLAPAQRKVGSTKKGIYDALIAGRMLRDAAVLFYSAEGEREEARALKLSAPSVVIPHGIDTEQFANLPARGFFRRKYLAGHQGPLVLYLGRLNTKKGLDLLIGAMAIVLRDIPDARLAIAGGGHPRAFTSQVRSWIRKAGIEAATALTGPLDQHAKLTAFADCDVFVLPSAAENFGFAMFEAMAGAKAVVCSDTLNYAHEVRKAKAGVVVDRTTEAFAAGIKRVLFDAEARERMGWNGQALAATYSWDVCGRMVETTIQCLLTGEPFPSELKPE